MHTSIGIYDSIKFIDLEPLDINPLMSKCTIKVFYLGNNRNRSNIKKEVGAEMARTLRGAPIVGHYREETEDFTDHGEEIVINDKGVQFKCLTKPYGFVPTDAKVWWQDFDEYDEEGQPVRRTYLCCTAFLWTGQFDECKEVVEDSDGRPHSMELDEKTLQGNWAKNYKNNLDFFIINSAVISKLCILGEETEPCFEGSSIKKDEYNFSAKNADDISYNFTLDKSFVDTCYSMIQDLKSVSQEGDKHVEKEEKTLVEEEVLTDFTKEEEKKDKEDKSSSSEKEDKKKETDFAADKKKEEEDKKEEDNSSDSSSDSKQDDSAKEESSSEKEDTASTDKEDEDKKKKPTKSTLEVELENRVNSLISDYAELQNKFTNMQAELDELRAYKAEIEDKEKDALINSFSMLSEEDKASVIARKSEMTCEDIKKELAVMCYDKRISFTSEKAEKEEIITSTFVDESSLPEWVKETKELMKTL